MSSEPVEKKGKPTFLATLSAVLWSFFGVRRSDKHTEDMQQLNPVHVIIVGVLAAAVFVLTLVGIVKMIVP
ncbi:MAG: DUF2970 domain-containing protein [Burkholderiales bacterium]|jgi:hypothetical protein|nr:DUF2970 domain-containing protein [Burkholderiales bacterium]